MSKKEDKENMVPKVEAEEQVLIMARRLALLYHHTAEVLVERYGEETGKKVLQDIIKRYGIECGNSIKEKVEELKLPLTLDNFDAGSDLPKWGWEADEVICEDGLKRKRINHCPLAEVWKEKGSEALGRIYCYVDQAKYEAYNGTKCEHLKNVLDDDECCLFDFS